jgi:hypothetical protein
MGQLDEKMARLEEQLRLARAGGLGQLNGPGSPPIQQAVPASPQCHDERAGTETDGPFCADQEQTHKSLGSHGVDGPQDASFCQEGRPPERCSTQTSECALLPGAEGRAIPSSPADVGEAKHWDSGGSCPREPESPILTADGPRKRQRRTEPADLGRRVGSDGHDELPPPLPVWPAATQALANRHVGGVEHDGAEGPAPECDAENTLGHAGCGHAADGPIYFYVPDDMHVNVNVPADSATVFGEGTYPQPSQEGGGVYDGQGAPPVYFLHGFQPTFW